MRQKFFLFPILMLVSIARLGAQDITGPYGENFSKKILTDKISDPWEITYGPDQHLWVTASKGYKVLRINPKNGEQQVVLNLSKLKNFPRYDQLPDDTDGGKPWPQGGLMGMALHPDLLKGKPFVYLTYIHSFSGANRLGKGEEPNHQGFKFTARLVCYEYDAKSSRLINPVILCDSVPASNDHNGGRLLAAPVGGETFIFYAVGDMGAGQYSNGGRTNYAQHIGKYEGKILRFNSTPDSDMDIYNRWIPNDNPFNTPDQQNAVWSYGHRNPQGLAFATINKQPYLYATEHGPFSDDEVNRIEKGKNYGHPLIIGYQDNNYNGYAAAVSDNSNLPGKWNTSYPLINSEHQNALQIGSDFREPIKSFYPATPGLLDTIFRATLDSTKEKPDWKAIAPSSLDIYTSTAIPGWKNSLLIPSLKEGKLIRLKLNDTGNGVLEDTPEYFKAPVRYRDLALSPDGKKIYLITDSSSVTSGPSSKDPSGISTRGAIIEFTYLNGGADFEELTTKASTVNNQKGAKSMLKKLITTLRSMDGQNAKRVLRSPEMKLAVNLLVKRRLTPDDIALSKKITESLVSTFKQE
jgi:PQQ-dependent dehydrogenase (s-GDH family)